MTLTKRAFVAWLREQNPGRRFKRGKPRLCPFAELLRAAGSTDVIIGDTVAWHDCTCEVLPLWAVRFVREMDRNRRRRTITAAECLALLREKP